MIDLDHVLRNKIDDIGIQECAELTGRGIKAIYKLRAGKRNPTTDFIEILFDSGYLKDIDRDILLIYYCNLPDYLKDAVLEDYFPGDE